MAVLTMVMSPISGHIVGSRGSRLPLVISGAALTIGCVMLTQIDGTTPFTWLFAAYAVFGFGFGLVNAPITNAAVSGMPRAQAGVAAGIASTSRQVGQTLGVAVVGAIVTSRVGGSVHADLAAASHLGWWILAGCGTTVLVLGLVANSRRALVSAQRTAAELNPEVLVGQSVEAA
jgi:MFS family permease